MASKASSDELAFKALNDCKNFQFLIDANTKHLEKLRAVTLSKDGHFLPTPGNTLYTFIDQLLSKNAIKLYNSYFHNKLVLILKT